MAEQLDPGGSPVQLGRLLLVTPGFAGTADLLPPGPPGVRGAAEATAPGLAETLDAQRFSTQEAVVLTDVEDLGSLSAGGDDIRLTAPGPGSGLGQVLLVQDAEGTTTWHLPVVAAPAGENLRGGTEVVYLLPRRVLTPAATGDGTTRGPLGFVARAVLRLLVFPLVDEALGRVGEAFVQRWEKRNRPYRLWVATPEHMGLTDPPEASPEELGQLLAGPPVLLLVHGTFSRARSAFAKLTEALPGTGVTVFDELYQRYEGRVLAFDHPTLHTAPEADAGWLRGRLPPGTRAVVDVLAHSRGGLVARCLAEQGVDGADRAVSVRRAVLTAVPNAGTKLASPGHLGDLVDAYTNLLSVFPDVAVTDVFEVVVAVVKGLAVGVATALPELMAMEPGSDFLVSLNAATTATPAYFAIAADYEPDRRGLQLWVADVLADQVFDAAPNDLVVPTTGAFGANGSSLFPVAERLEIPAVNGIGHSAYFRDPAVHAALRRRLPGTD